MNSEGGGDLLSQTRAICFIASYMIRREWIGVVVTLVFALYVGGFLSLPIDDMLKEAEAPAVLIGTTDWIYLTMFPCFGMVMNKTVFAMWRDDFYTKRLAYFRTMPIPLSAIIQFRIIQSVIMLVLIGSVFLLLQYLLSPSLREAASLSQWFTAGLVWLFFSILVNAAYTYLELGFNGKRYAQMYLAMMLGLAIVVSLLTWQEIHLFLEVLQLAKSDFALGWVALFMLLAIAGAWLGYRLTLERVRRRSISL